MIKTEKEAIVKEFKEQIVIPEKQWEGKQFVLCVAGKIGSGKTTFLKALCPHLGIVRVETDQLRMLLREHTIQYSSSELKEVVNDVVTYYLKRGYSVALDANAASPESISYIQNTEVELRVPSVWITFDIPESVALKRITARNNIFHGTPEAAIANYQTQELGTPLHAPVFTVTHLMSIDQAVDGASLAIMNYL